MCALTPGSCRLPQGALLQLESSLMGVSIEPEEASSDEEEEAAAKGSGDEGSEGGSGQEEEGDASRPISRAQVRCGGTCFF